MKNFPKILTAIFVFLFIFQASAFLFINLIPNANASDLNFKPQVTVGEFDKDNTKGYLVKGDTGMIGAYIKSIYEYAIGIAGIVAAAVLMYGGFSYLMAGGSADKISEAKSWIGAALSGLVLVMLSYTILSIINPKLLDFKISPIEPVDTVATTSDSESDTICCVLEYKAWTGVKSYKCFEEMPKEQCKENGFLYDNPDKVEQVIVENRQGGSCAFYKQAPFNCK